MHPPSLVIVLIVDEDCILTFKPERQTPVPANADRPVIPEFPGQPVQLPSRGIQVRWLARIVEREQLQAQPAGMLRLNPSFRSRAEKPLHAPMPEALDHSV